jgi:hypothetical protein
MLVVDTHSFMLPFSCFSCIFTSPASHKAPLFVLPAYTGTITAFSLIQSHGLFHVYGDECYSIEYHIYGMKHIPLLLHSVGTFEYAHHSTIDSH